MWLCSSVVPSLKASLKMTLTRSSKTFRHFAVSWSRYSRTAAWTRARRLVQEPLVARRIDRRNGGWWKASMLALDMSDRRHWEHWAKAAIRSIITARMTFQVWVACSVQALRHGSKCQVKIPSNYNSNNNYPLHKAPSPTQWIPCTSLVALHPNSIQNVAVALRSENGVIFFSFLAFVLGIEINFSLECQFQISIPADVEQKTSMIEFISNLLSIVFKIIRIGSTKSIFYLTC